MWTIQIWWNTQGAMRPCDRDPDEVIETNIAPSVSEALVTVPGYPLDGDNIMEQEDKYYPVASLAHFRIKKSL
jgi:hypothetical protein